MKYTVKQLSEIAGISVRTLHHYDQIDLLKPAFRSEKGYRFYAKEELLKLQQILFYKELGFSLKEIQDLFNDPSFNLLKALHFQKSEIQKRLEGMNELLSTIEKTIQKISGEAIIMKDEELFFGFNQKSFLLLLFIQANKADHIKSDKRVERFREWGNYFSKFGVDNTSEIVHGCPLNKNGFSVGQTSSKSFDNSNLGAYMVVRANSFQELQFLLQENPLVREGSGVVQIHELDPQRLL